jgi:hypothetical protein
VKEGEPIQVAVGVEVFGFPEPAPASRCWAYLCPLVPDIYVPVVNIEGTRTLIGFCTQHYQQWSSLCPANVEKPAASAKNFSYRRWVNIYSRTFGSGALSRMFASVKEADKYASEDRVACVEVVVEGKAGDGLRSAG